MLNQTIFLKLHIKLNLKDFSDLIVSLKMSASQITHSQITLKSLINDNYLASKLAFASLTPNLVIQEIHTAPGPLVLFFSAQKIDLI